MATEQQDITVVELLERIETGQLGGIHELATSVLDGVQSLVDSILARTEPRTTLTDRFAWTGSSLADQLGQKYESEDALISSTFELPSSQPLSRLARSSSSSALLSGYSFFDFEGLVFTEADDWDALEDDYARESLNFEAKQRRSMFAQDVRTQARLSPEGELGFEKVLVKDPKSAGPQTARRPAASAPRRRAAMRTPTPIRPPGAMRTQRSRSPYPKAMATPPTLGLSPLLERAIEMVERAQAASHEAPSERLSLENILPGSDWVAEAEGTPTQAPVGEPRRGDHRIQDISVKRQSMPALSGALDAVKGVSSRVLKAQERSLTSSVDFRPLKSASRMGVEGDADMSLVQPGAEEFTETDATASHDTSVRRVERVQPTAVTQPKPPARWTMKELVRSTEPSPATRQAPSAGERRLSPVSASGEEGSPQSVDLAAGIAPGRVESQLPIFQGRAAKPATSEKIGAPSVVRTSMGLRPVVPLEPLAMGAQQKQPGLVKVQDVFIPASAAPALAVGMAEARGVAGLPGADVAPLSRVSASSVDRMMGSQVLLPVHERLPGEGALSSGFEGDDFAFVVPTAYDAFVETPQESAPAPIMAARGPEPSLKEIVQGSAPQPSGRVPVEHQILARRALGSRLPLSLSEPKAQADAPVEQQVSTPTGPELALRGLGTDWANTGTPSLRARAELAPWTLDSFDKILDSAEGAALIRSGASESLSFWKKLAERGEGDGVSAQFDAMGDLDASVVQLVPDEAPTDSPLASPVAETGDAPKADEGWSREKLRTVLSRAAAKSGVAADPLIPKLAKEVTARSEFSDQKLFGSSLLDVWAATPASSEPEAIGRFAEALRRELHVEGASDAALLSIPAEIAAASQSSTGLVSAPVSEPVSEPVSAPEYVSSSEPAMAAPVPELGMTSGARPKPRLESAARLTRQLSRMLQSLLRGSAHGMPLAGLRWENGPATQTLDAMVDKMLATPSGQVLLAGGSGEAGSPSMNVEQSDAIFLQPWLEDAFREVISSETSVASRGEDRFERPGVAMGMSVGRVMAGQGAVSSRLRALMSEPGESGATTKSTLGDIYGWEDFSQLSLGQGEQDFYGDESVHSERGDSSFPAVSPGHQVSSGTGQSVPLGLPPSGTSMDMGRLSHVMMRSSAAAPADFNLVSPVTMAVAETAQLKPKEEPIGDLAGNVPAEADAGGSGEESKDIPSEIVDLLSYEIASRISYRMKFEQDRSGRWD